LVSKLKGKIAVKEAVRLSKFIESLDVEMVFEKGLADLGGLGKGVPLSDLYADLIITFGGDGTVLRTCMQIPEAETPILAVNLGRRGFLTEVNPEEAENAIKRCLSGDYVLEENSKLSLYLNDQFLVDGLNEVLITPSTLSKLLRLHLLLGKEEITQFSADGIMVSTPTGSTAHAFSAGGPIIHSALNAFNIVLICPLGPVKSIVVPDDQSITIAFLRKDVSIMATVDGFFSRRIKPSDKIMIKKSKHKASFIRFNRNHLKRTLSKLSLRDSLILNR